MGKIILIAILAFAVYLVLRARRASEPESPAPRDSGLPEDQGDAGDDAWEGAFWEAADPKPVQAHIEVDYEDSNGNQTTRAVRVRKFDNQLLNGIMIGRCELRDATRTFRFDRVRRCVDLETGEEVDVRVHLSRLYEESPGRSIERLMSDYADVVKVLLFVVKADGQYRREEKALVTAYLRQLLKDDRITAELVDEGLSQMDLPSLQGYKLALGRVLKSGEVEPKRLQQCCHDIVATQKSAHPSEQAALDYLDGKVGV